MHKELLKIKNKLIVSCQAENDSPFNSPEGVAMFAIAAEQGGAGGIRSEGIAKTKRIKELVNLPVIGLIKNKFDDGYVRITRTFEEVEQLCNLGIDIISVDGTFRKANGLTGPEFIAACKKKYPNVCFMADISTIEDAKACIENGTDIISTTLRGYTPETQWQANFPIDLSFVKELKKQFHGFPLVAEGKINTTIEAMEVADLGVWSVVIGSAITRPHIITNRFINALNWK
jgi:N-acylglucosamine-6-phosphate 2-epimerase